MAFSVIFTVTSGIILCTPNFCVGTEVTGAPRKASISCIVSKAETEGWSDCGTGFARVTDELWPHLLICNGGRSRKHTLRGQDDGTEEVTGESPDRAWHQTGGMYQPLCLPCLPKTEV